MSTPQLHCCSELCGELPVCSDDPTKHAWDGDEIVLGLAVTLDITFKMNGTDYTRPVANSRAYLNPNAPGIANYIPAASPTPYAQVNSGVCPIDDHSWYLTVFTNVGGTLLYEGWIDSIQPVSAGWTADYVAPTYTFENVETVKTS